MRVIETGAGECVVVMTRAQTDAFLGIQAALLTMGEIAERLKFSLGEEAGPAFVCRRPKGNSQTEGEEAAKPVARKEQKQKVEKKTNRERFKHSKVNRNKKCRVCGDSFFDESLRARRAFCGEGRCKRDALKTKPRMPRELPTQPVMGM